MRSRVMTRAGGIVGGICLGLGVLGVAAAAPASASGLRTPAPSGHRAAARLLPVTRPHLSPPSHLSAPAAGNVSPAALRTIRTRERSQSLRSMPATPTASTTFNVNTAEDSPLANSSGTTCTDQQVTPRCSLRAAVQAADNLHKAVVIKLPSNTYNLTDTSLGSLLVDNTGGTDIVGAGAGTTKVAVPSGDTYGVLTLTDATTSSPGSTLWLSGVTLTGGDATDGGGFAMVYANDAAVLSNVVITANTATSGGGGLSCGEPAEGGGSLWVSNSSITHNTALDGGGVYEYWCNVHFTKVTVNSNTATDDGGGGIFIDYGNVSLTGGSVSADTAGGLSTAGYGGGIYNEYGLSQLDNVTINNDSVLDDGWGGGDFEYWSQLTMTGGSLSHDSAHGTTGAGGGLAVEYGALVALHGVPVTYDSTQSTSSYYGGGGIYLYVGDDYAATALTIDDHSSISHDTTGGIASQLEYGGATVDISNSTLTGNSSHLSYCGGAICEYAYDYGGLAFSLTNDTITSNTESGTYSAGAIMDYAYEYAAGDLTMTGDTVEHNSTTSDGAGAVVADTEYYGQSNVTMTGDTFDSNHATGSGGTGAIQTYTYEYANGPLHISNSTLSGNTAPDAGEGGAIAAFDGDYYGAPEVVLQRDLISHNVAGSSTSGHNGYGGGVYISYYATLNAVDSTIADNTAVGNHSAGGSGGGVYDGSYQTASYTGDKIAGNQATGLDSEGGGVYSYDEYGGDYLSHTTISGNRAESGAGLFAEDAYNLELANSTLSGNVAGSSAQTGYGGGLYLTDVALDATNSTIARNVAEKATGGKPGAGGGVYSTSGGADTFQFTTISANAAAVGAGYDDANNTNAAGGALMASILSGNTTVPGGKTEADCASYDAAVRLVSAGDNVIGQAKCVVAVASSDKVTAKPGLDALASNGGPTQTMALTSTSPALKRAAGPCPATDQRGNLRPSSHCDAGAYERTSGATAVIPSSGTVGTSLRPWLGHRATARLT